VRARVLVCVRICARAWVCVGAQRLAVRVDTFNDHVGAATPRQTIWSLTRNRLNLLITSTHRHCDCINR